jgi:hypothetical protein
MSFSIVSQRWLSQGEAWEMVFVAQGDGGLEGRRRFERVHFEGFSGCEPLVGGISPP